MQERKKKGTEQKVPLTKSPDMRHHHRAALRFIQIILWMDVRSSRQCTLGPIVSQTSVWDHGTRGRPPINVPDKTSKQQLTEAYALLAEVGQLLEEYAPVWFSEDLHDRLQAALRDARSVNSDVQLL